MGLEGRPWVGEGAGWPGRFRGQGTQRRQYLGDSWYRHTVEREEVAEGGMKARHDVHKEIELAGQVLGLAIHEIAGKVPVLRCVRRARMGPQDLRKVSPEGPRAEGLQRSCQGREGGEVLDKVGEERKHPCCMGEHFPRSLRAATEELGRVEESEAR